MPNTSRRGVCRLDLQVSDCLQPYRWLRSVQRFPQTPADFLSDERCFFKSGTGLLRITRLSPAMAAGDIVSRCHQALLPLIMALMVRSIAGSANTLSMPERSQVMLSPWRNMIWGGRRVQFTAREFCHDDVTRPCFDHVFAEAWPISPDRVMQNKEDIHYLARHLESCKLSYGSNSKEVPIWLSA